MRAQNRSGSQKEKNIKRAILFGPLRSSLQVQKLLFSRINPVSSDLWVGVDGGTYLWKKLGISPDFAIGDWDSLGKNKSLLKHIPHVTLSPKKARSDLFYAALAAIEAGAEEIVCLGVTGSRPDHHLAVLYDLSVLSSGKYGTLKKVWALGEDAEFHFLSREIPDWIGTYPPKTLVSTFAIGCRVEGLTLKGFKYPLKGEILEPSSLGLSNEILRKKAHVHLRKGQLLIIIPHLRR